MDPSHTKILHRGNKLTIVTPHEKKGIEKKDTQAVEEIVRQKSQMEKIARK